jgi:hypothetical protein
MLTQFRAEGKTHCRKNANPVCSRRRENPIAEKMLSQFSIYTLLISVIVCFQERGNWCPERWLSFSFDSQVFLGQSGGA